MMLRLNLKDPMIEDAILRKSKLYSGDGNPIGSTDGALDVLLQDNVTDIFALFLGNQLATPTLEVAASAGDEVIDINSTVAPVVDNFITIQEGVRHLQVKITSVVANGGGSYTVGLSMPLDFSITTGVGLELADAEFNVNGSVTPVQFSVGPDAGVKWQITSMTLTAISATKPEDGKFIDLTTLTNGVYFYRNGTFIRKNFFNSKRNADFRTVGVNLSYYERSTGAVVELDGDHNDRVYGVVRDDLSAITGFRVRVRGHVVK